jgi:hypothetical protein
MEMYFKFKIKLYFASNRFSLLINSKKSMHWKGVFGSTFLVKFLPMWQYAPNFSQIVGIL